MGKKQKGILSVAVSSPITSKDPAVGVGMLFAPAIQLVAL